MVPIDTSTIPTLRPKWDQLSQLVVWRLQDLLSLKYRLKARLRLKKKRQGPPSKFHPNRRQRLEQDSPRQLSFNDPRSELSPRHGQVQEEQNKMSTFPDDLDHEPEQLFTDPFAAEDLELEVPAEGLNINFSATKVPFSPREVESYQLIRSQQSRTQPNSHKKVPKLSLIPEEGLLISAAKPLPRINISGDGSTSQSASDSPRTRPTETADLDESFELHQPEHFDEARLAAIGYTSWGKEEPPRLLKSTVNFDDDQAEDNPNPQESPDGLPSEVLKFETHQDFELETEWAVLNLSPNSFGELHLLPMLKFIDVGFFSYLSENLKILKMSNAVLAKNSQLRCSSWHSQQEMHSLQS